MLRSHSLVTTVYYHIWQLYKWLVWLKSTVLRILRGPGGTNQSINKRGTVASYSLLVELRAGAPSFLCLEVTDCAAASWGVWAAILSGWLYLSLLVRVVFRACHTCHMCKHDWTGPRAYLYLRTCRRSRDQAYSLLHRTCIRSQGYAQSEPLSSYV